MKLNVDVEPSRKFLSLMKIQTFTRRLSLSAHLEGNVFSKQNKHQDFISVVFQFILDYFGGRMQRVICHLEANAPFST